MGNWKVVILGVENVGKTTIMESILDKIGKTDYKGTTVAIDYGNLVLDGKKIHIFGTPGQERFQFMRELTLAGVDFAVVVLDGSRGVIERDKEIIDTLESMGVPYLIFVNKIDIADREQLDKLLNEIKDYCKNYYCIVEGSALKGEGLDRLKKAILSLCDEITKV